MRRRIAERLVSSLLVVLGAGALTFFLVHAIPADPAVVIAGPKADSETLEAIRRDLHLDEPVWLRFGRHMARLVRLDLGRSYVTQQAVSDAILSRLPLTASLATLAVIFWMVIAIPVGVCTARWQGGWWDRGVLVMAGVTLSLPAFWFARLVQYGLAYRMGWFPIAGYVHPGHLVLPALTLAAMASGYYARLVHAGLVEVLDSGYVRTARAKGLSEWRVLSRHALRNALLPVVTVLAVDLAGLLGGVMFVENVFALPGMGTLAVQSVFNLDPPMIVGTVMVSAIAMVVANLGVDLVHGWLDPRIRG